MGEWSGKFIRMVFLLLMFFSSIGLLSLPPAFAAGTVSLAWDANTESDLAGYRVYMGTSSGNYGIPTNVGKVTQHTKTNLQSNTTYFFGVTAYDQSGNEGSPSNEVSVTTSGSSTSTSSSSLVSNINVGSGATYQVASGQWARGGQYHLR
jgi:chitodextrinase